MPSIQFPAKWWTRLSLSFVAFLLTDTVKGDQHILTLQCERRSHFCRAAGLTVLGFWLLEASTINSLWASKAFLTILTWQKESTEHKKFHKTVDTKSTKTTLLSNPVACTQRAKKNPAWTGSKPVTCNIGAAILHIFICLNLLRVYYKLTSSHMAW